MGHFRPPRTLPGAGARAGGRAEARGGVLGRYGLAGPKRDWQDRSSPGVRTWSPTVLLIWPNGAYVPSADGMGGFHHGMNDPCHGGQSCAPYTQERNFDTLFRSRRTPRLAAGWQVELLWGGLKVPAQDSAPDPKWVPCNDGLLLLDSAFRGASSASPG